MNYDELAENASKGPFTSSPQVGEKGHCQCAQVFDGTEEGLSVAIMNTDDAERATANAQIIKHHGNNFPKLLAALDEIVLCDYGGSINNALIAIKEAQEVQSC